MISYISTRGQAPELSFEEVVLAGLATDGGLYVPNHVPSFTSDELAQMKSLSYTELAIRVMQPFIGEAIPMGDLRALVEDAYKSFRHVRIAPLKELKPNEYLLELFHGPTLAFKDFALQLLGRLLEYFLLKRNETITIIGATSGDTGSAAIEGCRGRKNMRLFILYPDGRVSDVQRRQMTTVLDNNVFCLALEGTFDDCQTIVKVLFADAAFREKYKLAAVNSINWARILAQIVYYFYAGLALDAPGRKLRFCVPTGNFGDIYAGYIAHRMGLPIEQLIIATNSNDILARCLKSGIYSTRQVMPTTSPSMDIQISSNFERLLFDLYDHDGTTVRTLMESLAQDGKFTLEPQALTRLRNLFAAGSADDDATRNTIAEVYKQTGDLIDPHSAVGVHVARRTPSKSTAPIIILATAHPAKFPEVVKEAGGIMPSLPAHLQGLMQRAERIHSLPADWKSVQSFIEKHS